MLRGSGRHKEQTHVHSNVQQHQTEIARKLKNTPYSGNVT